MRAITNPNEVISGLIPQPKPQDPNAKRLEDFKFARALGGVGLDYGIGEPDKPKELPPAESPIFPVAVDSAVEDKLPRGYNMRSLQRDDYDRGYTKLKSVGPIPLNAWNERCEYFRSRADVYTILVITDNNDEIVATGTLVLERKFSASLTTVGHIEDLAVGEGQSGKNLGLRLLDQLDRLANNAGCVRSVLGTQEQNEAFHKQKSESSHQRHSFTSNTMSFTDFRRAGIEMTHIYKPQIGRRDNDRWNPFRDRSREPKSRNASPERRERERSIAAQRLAEPVTPNETI